MTKGMKIIHVNTRSIFRKVSLLQCLYADVDFLCCSETWLDDRTADNLIRINDMSIFRNDRGKDIRDYNVHVIGGGVCIFVSKKWYEFTQVIDEGTCITSDYEIISLEISKPNFRKLFVACLYKAPKGNVEKCLSYLKKLVQKYQRLKFEIWILGDFNVDMLKRDDLHTVQVLSFVKKQGLKQLIKDITRPNKKGGTCIDLIMTDSIYISDFGVLNDFVSDHYSVFCNRKKPRERKETVSRMVRDYKAFDKNNFDQLLKNSDWGFFDNSFDPNVQWEIILQKINDILAIMSPYKKVNTRKKTTPWLTQEIFKAMREKKILIKRYKLSRDNDLLRQLRIKRNEVNSMIDRAKTEFITTSLNRTVSNPKKFWKLIKCLIDKDDIADITSYSFRNQHADPVEKSDIPDFLNNYFVNIAERTVTHQVIDCPIYRNEYDHINGIFDFVLPTMEDMYIYMEQIDVNSSSCIPGINNKMCKLAMDSIPSKFRHLFVTSLDSGIFPMSWTNACVTLLPKDGDKSQPGNWRPISQTVVFAKILEKIVHKQLLSYFMENNVLSDYQFGFLPERSTQESVFNTTKHLYSALNNNKMTGILFLDMAKAFNCINHVILYNKLKDVGACDRVIAWFRSYLTRTQTVKYGDVHSERMNIPAGIAQGTVLGPLIFIFYINDCINVLDKVKVSMFADDCVLYYSGHVYMKFFNRNSMLLLIGRIEIDLN